MPYMNRTAAGLRIFCLLVSGVASAESLTSTETPGPGQAFRGCVDCPEMVVIPAGIMEKVRPVSKAGRGNDKGQQYSVSIRSFALGKTEVTQGQWKAVMGSNPSKFSKCGDDCPVERVSWNHAQEFIRRLNQKTGMSYRLPSDAEWEYACRAGKKDKYCGSEKIESVAWYESNSGKTTHSVASKQPNAWGLYDMTGNVWEWTSEQFEANRVIRGGSAYYPADECRTNAPYQLDPFFRSSNVGIRLVLEVDCPSADLTGDCQVDLADFAVLAANWLDDGSILDMEWVLINDPGVSGHEGFRGMMGKYEVTNAQYCEFLNTAKATGDITFNSSVVKGASGINKGEDYVGGTYYNLLGGGLDLNNPPVTNGGASRIHYNGTSFVVDSGFENHPVTYVTWYGASAFCSYYGYRLPTEWEWEAAADFDGTYLYGYGPVKDTAKANCNVTNHPDGTTAVGAFGTYGYGLADISGNVYEFTNSMDGIKWVLRGGGWVSADNFCSISSRITSHPDSGNYDRGFRVVRDTP